MTENDLIMVALNVQAQLKLLHWQTNSYAAHKALDETYVSLDKLFDRLIEVYQGLNSNRITVTNGTMEVIDIDSLDFPSFIVSTKKFFMKDIEELINDQSITNIVDDILSEVNKLQYLLTFE